MREGGRSGRREEWNNAESWRENCARCVLISYIFISHPVQRRAEGAGATEQRGLNKYPRVHPLGIFLYSTRARGWCPAGLTRQTIIYFSYEFNIRLLKRHNILTRHHFVSARWLSVIRIYSKEKSFKNFRVIYFSMNLSIFFFFFNLCSIIDFIRRNYRGKSRVQWSVRGRCLFNGFLKAPVDADELSSFVSKYSITATRECLLVCENAQRRELFPRAQVVLR